MADPIELRTGGPHSPEYTRQVAETIAEAVRVLNYAARPGSGGLESPQDVHDLLGALMTTAGRLPQLLGQLSAWLQNESAAGRLRVDQGSSIEAVAEAGTWFMRANDAAAALGYALDQAHQITATMSAAKRSADG